MTAELKNWRRIFTALASIWSNIITNSNEKKTWKRPVYYYMSIVYIQISNSYLQEFLNTLRRG